MSSPSPINGASIPPEMLIFFRDIKEHPDDDTPRLIFADWLQEHGNAAAAARGEFLRLQVLRGRLSPDNPNYPLLKRREGELFTEHCWTWLGPLRDAAKEWRFERGMVQITAQGEKLLTPEVTAWMSTEAGLWIDALTLTEVTPPHIAQLVEAPFLPQLHTLDLSDNRLRGLSPILQLANAPGLRNLVSLKLLKGNRFSTNATAFLRRTFGDRLH